MSTQPVRPTLAELLSAYSDSPCPWGKAKALKGIMSDRLNANLSRGRGTRAAKREAEILTHKMATGGITFSRATRRMRLQRAADLMAESTTEARSMATHYRTNFHDE